MTDLLLFDLRRLFKISGVVLASSPRLLRHLVFERPAKLSAAGETLRRMLERLEITFLKLGQFLAMRFDLLPAEICRQLFENVEPLSFESVRLRVEDELGGRLDELFAHFDPQPLAAASVAQVHRARSRDGQELAIKVQRPGIRALFDADMRILSRLAGWVDRLGLVRHLSLSEALDEFADYTQREMDFLTEGRTAERLRTNSGPGERIPRIWWELTTSRVLTMDFIEGLSLARVVDLVEDGRTRELEALLPGVDLRQVGERFARASLRQLYIHGFFHADPHPGNILVCPDGSVAFIDFGIFGEISQTQRQTLARYVEYLSMGRLEESLYTYSRLLTFPPGADRRAFVRDGLRVLANWYRAANDPDLPPEERYLGRSSGEMLELIHRYRLRMSLDTLFFWRALLVLDSTGLRLGQHFDMLANLRHFFLNDRPESRARELWTHLWDQDQARVGQELAVALPRSLDHILGDLAQHRFPPAVVRSHPPRARRQLTSGAGSLALGLAAVSLAVAASVLPASLWLLFGATGLGAASAAVAWRS